MSDIAKRKILIIDDDASLLTTLSDFLSFEGYDIATADSGEEGLARLESLTPDLIILDMSMPGMGGVGFLKAISDARGKPSHPVLVLTARANMAEFFANVDVDGFVAKPCDPNDLLMEVARIIFLRSGGEQEGQGSSSAAQGAKLLLGEDDPLVSDRLSHAFMEAGYTVERVTRGPELMEQAILSHPDLVVLKQVLPGMNGDKVAEMLKLMPNTQQVGIVLYDASGSLPHAMSAIGRGIQAVVRSNATEALLSAVTGLPAA
jgi:CheY-like chemotaxis protein